MAGAITRCCRGLACLRSSTYPLTKIGPGSIPPITFISARSLIAAAFLFVVLRDRGRLARRR